MRGILLSFLVFPWLAVSATEGAPRCKDNKCRDGKDHDLYSLDHKSWKTIRTGTVTRAGHHHSHTHFTETKTGWSKTRTKEAHGHPDFKPKETKTKSKRANIVPFTAYPPKATKASENKVDDTRLAAVAEDINLKIRDSITSRRNSRRAASETNELEISKVPDDISYVDRENLLEGIDSVEIKTLSTGESSYEGLVGAPMLSEREPTTYSMFQSLVRRLSLDFTQPEIQDLTSSEKRDLDTADVEKRKVSELDDGNNEVVRWTNSTEKHKTNVTSSLCDEPSSYYPTLNRICGHHSDRWSGFRGFWGFSNTSAVSLAANEESASSRNFEPWPVFKLLKRLFFVGGSSSPRFQARKAV